MTETPQAPAPETTDTTSKSEPRTMSTEHQSRVDLAKVLSDEAAARKAAAEADKAETDAEKAADDAVQARLTGILPDVSKVERGSLEVTGDSPVFSAALGYRAMRAAAASVANEMSNLGEARVLVTSDPDLATSTSTYLEVVAGLQALVDAGEAAMGDDDPCKGLEGQPTQMLGVAATATVGAINAISAALPGVLSLFAARRSVTTKPVTTSHLGACAEVIRAMGRQQKGGKFFHDGFRIARAGHVYRLAERVSVLRNQLGGRVLDLTRQHVIAQDALRSAEAAVAAAEKALKEGEQDQENLRKALAEAKDAVLVAQARSDVLAASKSLCEGTLSTIDKTMTALHAVPANGRSMLSTASLLESVYPNLAPADESIEVLGHVFQQQPAPETFNYILLIKAEGGQATQLLDDKPLMLNDKVSSYVDVTLQYMLIDTSSSRVTESGVASGAAQLHGTIGSELEVAE